MPNSPISQGLMNAFSIDQSSQHISLAQQELEQNKKKLEMEKDKESFHSMIDMLQVPNMPTSYYESIAQPFNVLAKKHGYGEIPASVFSDAGNRGKEFRKALASVSDQIQKNPNMDSKPMLNAIQQTYSGVPGMEAGVTKLEGEITDLKKKSAEDTLSRIQGSGGVADQTGLAESFARSGGTPELRAAGLAQSQIGKKTESTPSLERDLNAEANRRGLTGQAAYDFKQKERAKAAGARAEAYAGLRQYSAIDTKEGNAPTFISAFELNRAAKEEPGRYLSGGEGAKALNKTALIEDIRGAIGQTRDALNNPQLTEFSKGDKAKIIFALRERDPRSAMSAFINSSAAASLTPAQQDYIMAMAQLTENAMAMRSVLGAGQGSDQLREAIRSTIPSLTTPTKEYGLKQLVLVERQIDRLERGVPTVPLRGEAPPTTAPGAGKQLDATMAGKFLQQAGGDKEKARKLARDQGYNF